MRTKICLTSFAVSGDDIPGFSDGFHAGIAAIAMEIFGDDIVKTLPCRTQKNQDRILVMSWSSEEMILRLCSRYSTTKHHKF